MKKAIIVLTGALGLAGCATAPKAEFVHAPAVHVAPVAKPAPAPVVVTPPASPVTITKIGKPRWYDEFKSGTSRLRSHIHFHKKAADPAVKGN